MNEALKVQIHTVRLQGKVKEGCCFAKLYEHQIAFSFLLHQQVKCNYEKDFSPKEVKSTINTASWYSKYS